MLQVVYQRPLRHWNATTRHTTIHVNSLALVSTEPNLPSLQQTQQTRTIHKMNESEFEANNGKSRL